MRKNILLSLQLLLLISISVDCFAQEGNKNKHEKSAEFKEAKEMYKQYMKRKDDPIPIDDVEKISGLFKARLIENNSGVSFQPKVTLQSETLKTMRKLFNNSHLLAVFGLRRGEITITLLPSNEDGTAVSQIKPEGYQTIVANQEQLKKLLAEGIPLNLKQFPLVLKMPMNNLERIVDETKCSMLLLFPGIENEKLTVCVVGSDDGRVAHELHYLAEKPVMAEETWPDRNFTYYRDRRGTDVVLDGRG